MLPETTSGIVKLVSGSSVAGVGVAYAVAAGVAGDAPSLPPHGTLELLGLASIAYIWTQINALRKKATPVDAPRENSGERKTANDWLLERLEKIAFGVDTSNTALTEHRIEFAEFRGETVSELSSLNKRVDRLERRRTDEIPRPPST